MNVIILHYIYAVIIFVIITIACVVFFIFGCNLIREGLAGEIEESEVTIKLLGVTITITKVRAGFLIIITVFAILAYAIFEFSPAQRVKETIQFLQHQQISGMLNGTMPEDSGAIEGVKAP